MSQLSEKINSKKFVLTSEVGPPKGTDMKVVLEDAELLKDKVDAINVTDIQSSVMRVGSLVTCHLLKQRGIEPVLQMVCRDRNRLALQSDLLSADVLGIENVLALTGDHPILGDHPQAKPVFDLDSVQLLNTIQVLMSGKDLSDTELQGTPKFYPGAVVNSGAEPLEPQIIKMEQKIAAGAKFFQTQAVYDTKVFEKFIKAAKHLDTTILLGIVFLKSAGMAKFMNANVAGVFVPDNLIKEISEVAKEDRKKKSAEIAVRLVNQMKDMCQGVHFMPLGWDKVVVDVLDQLSL